MLKQLRPGRGVDADGAGGRRGGSGEIMRHLRGAVGETGSEPVGICSLGREAERMLTAEFVQMTHRELKNVGLFQFADVLTFGLEGRHNEVFELVQAFVDSGATFAFQHRLHNLDKQECNKHISWSMD